MTSKMLDIVKAKQLSEALAVFMTGLMPEVYQRGRGVRRREDFIDQCLAAGQHPAHVAERLREIEEVSHLVAIGAVAEKNASEQADPNAVDSDWRAAFLSNARKITSEQMQAFWGKVLADEMNAPGSFSVQTVNILAGMNPADAEMFARLCRFSVTMFHPLEGDRAMLLVFDLNDDVYRRAGLTFEAIQDLESLGLVSEEAYGVGGSRQSEEARTGSVAVFGYGSTRIFVHSQPSQRVDLGNVVFTRAGRELRRVVETPVDAEILRYVIDHWSLDHKVTMARGPQEGTTKLGNRSKD